MKYFILLILLLNLSCTDNDNTTIGNPLVSLKILPYSTPQAFSKLTPFAVSSLQFCVKRLRFKTDQELTNPITDEDEDNVDINLGLINIDPTGTVLTEVNIPKGEYTRIEFDLEPDCAGEISPSVILSNDNSMGTPFVTNDDITIQFRGLISLNSTTSISLNISSMIQALSNVTDADEIESVLENSQNEGDFDEDD